jgi:hypothetical protein
MKQFDFVTEMNIRHQHEATARHVQHQQFVRAALANPVHVRRSRFYQPALMIVGRRLVVWGTRLQSLYPEPAAAAEVTLATQNK